MVSSRGQAGRRLMGLHSSTRGDALIGGRYVRRADVLDSGLNIAEGQDVNEGTPVTIWTAPADVVAASILLRLQHEVTVLQRLEPEGIVPVLWVGREADTVSLVAAKPSGTTVAEHLALAPLTAEETLMLAES